LRRGRPPRGADRDEPEDEAALRAQAGRGKGGVDVVDLTMPGICIPEISEYDAAAEAIRAELGISLTAMRMQPCHSLTVMGEVRAGSRELPSEILRPSGTVPRAF
jgi:hypothetical protein